MTLQNRIQQAADLIRGSQRLTALTGAGETLPRVVAALDDHA